MSTCFVKKLRDLAVDANLPYYGAICITINTNATSLAFTLSDSTLGDLLIKGICEGDCYFATSGGERIGTVLDETTNVVNTCYVKGTGKVYLINRYDAKKINFPANANYEVDIEDLIWAPNTIDSIVGQGIVGDLTKINYTHLSQIELRGTNTVGDITDLVLNNISSLSNIILRGSTTLDVDRAFENGSNVLWNISAPGFAGDFSKLGNSPLERLYVCAANNTLTGSMEDYVAAKLIKYPNTAGRLIISVGGYLTAITYNGQTITNLITNSTIPQSSDYYTTMKWDAQGNITWHAGQVS